MRNAIRPALALLALAGLMFAHRAMGQTQDWPWLGVIITDISSGNVEGYGGGGPGSYVTGVEYAGPAFAAGLLRHDIIVAVDGRTALNTRELTCIIQGKRPGDVVSVTIMRAGRRQSVPATLGRWPPSHDFPRPALANCGKDPVS
jgi:S1-C subfamily serine protease